MVAVTLVMVALGIGLSLGVAVWAGDPPAARDGLIWSCLLTLSAAAILWFATRGRVDLSRRDGFGIVTFGWLAAATFGALPYTLSGTIPDPVGAVFETMSGFTTTGASILTDLEALPRGILFWRALTQWLGGMGVLVLCVAILPFLGVGGMQIYRAEMPGPSKDRLTPRIARTAGLLWGVYVLLTLAETLLLHVGGMSWFDAVCHTFTTLSTGGFSTRTESVAAFDSLYLELVIIAFMFLSSVNFALHYRALTGAPQRYFTDPEFRFFCGILTGSILLVTLNIWKTSCPSLGEAARQAAFQCTSIMSTTGFCTADFDTWPDTSRMVLMTLMFLGGCAGSTGGGIKMVRIFVLFKAMLREIRTYMLPNAVLRVKLGRKALEPSIINNISAFFVIFIAVFGVASLIMSFYTPDFVTAASSVIASLGNIGPGLAEVGATKTYAFIPAPGKMVLTFCMLLGRLELYTVLALFLPSFWRK